MALAILMALALQATSEATPKVYEVDFAPLQGSERRFAYLGPVGPYYPDRAVRAHLTGVTILRCTAGDGGQLQHCRAVSEKPDRAGFAEAALIMAARSRIKAAGFPPVGETVLVRVPFSQGRPPNSDSLRLSIDPAGVTPN